VTVLLQLHIRMMLKIENMTLGCILRYILKKPLRFENRKIAHINIKSWEN